MYLKHYLYLILTIILIYSCDKKNLSSSIEASNDSKSLKEIKTSSNAYFKRLSTNETGLNFSNTITHDLSTKFNLFDYDYFYNGAGVATADFNNDGLLDIFFAGNQVANKLYLNKGNLTFEDISTSSKINQNKYWASGVSIVDINNDDYLDIYISQGGPHQKEHRKNVLLINNKDLTFSEESDRFGLADNGISTQSAFFDYDKDGDLDCIVMNENDFYGLDPARFNKVLSDPKLLQQNSSHLYQNNNGKFIDVTESAGLLRPSFGLGLGVSDINKDGWLDIYIANDYYVPDALYINNKNGTFTESISNSTNQISFYGMGLDIADINNDNLNDIVVLDMASSDHIRSKTLMASMNVPQFNLLTNDLDYQHQYMFNSVQLNVGNSKFHNVAALTGMSKTDWSWAALVMDANLDGLNDIYVTNGYRRYALDNDSRRKVVQAQRNYQGNVPLEVKQSIYDGLPSEKLSNILYQNKGDLHFENVSNLSELNIPSFSNGAVYADLDNDGDLDLVVNNMDDEAFIFKNEAIEKNSGNYLKIKTKGLLSEDFATVEVKYNGQKQTKNLSRVRGYLSAVEKIAHFGLGYTHTIDTLTVTWPSGKYVELFDVEANTTLEIAEIDALQTNSLDNQVSYPLVRNNQVLNSDHKENTFNDFAKEVLLPYKQSTLGPSIVKADVNGDNLEDLFIGGAFGFPGQLYLQESNGFKLKSNQVFIDDKNYEDMESVFIDIDSDNDLDLFVVSGGSEFNERSPQLIDRVYFNDGQGNFSNSNYAELSNYAISGKAIASLDFDNDGDRDIIIGNRIIPQKYPLHDPSIIYLNDNGTFKNVTGTIAPEFEDFGMVNDILVTDFNNDGQQDFIAVGEWTHIGMFQNKNGVFEDVSTKYNLDQEKGWWFSAKETDLNNDGHLDYVIGNIGKNIKLKVSKSKPLRVYATDFDNNNTHDVVLSYKYNDTFVPLRGKECSTQQMPFIAEKVPTFQQFANSSLQDIYGDAILTAYTREANQFNSVVLMNDGSNNYSLKKLPILAQTMPILDMASIDFNNDGIQDIIAVGNIYETEVETPRLDNGYGIVIQGDNEGNFKVLMPQETGFYISGNAKSVEVVKVNGKEQIIVGCNDGPIEVFEKIN